MQDTKPFVDPFSDEFDTGIFTVPQDKTDKIAAEILNTLTPDQLLYCVANMIGYSGEEVIITVQSLEFGQVDVSIDATVAFRTLLKSIKHDNAQQIEQVLNQAERIIPSSILIDEQEEPEDTIKYNAQNPPMCITS